jgi:hypothetical protein
LEADQKASGGESVFEDGVRVIWTAKAIGSDAKYFAIFNVGEKETIDIPVDWASLGMPTRCMVRDLWEHRDVGAIENGHTFHLAPHCAGLFKLTPAR